MDRLTRNASARGALCGALLALAAASASAQIPDKFTNLKVLPQDIRKGELVAIMRSFAGALGTRCNHCHVGENPNTLEGFDFASDAKEPKAVARAMMRMVRVINDSLLPAAGRAAPVEVRCITCHRGVEKPETLDRILLAAVEKDSVPGAVARYRELRERYYGQGSYDFSARTLNQVAEILANERSNVAGAIGIMEFNVQVNPDAAYSHLLLGQLYAKNGNKEAAVASIERCLQLEPDNQWAKQVLERVRTAK